MKHLFVLIIGILSITVFACKPYPCKNPSLRIVLPKTLDSTQLAVFTVEEYEKGTNFSVLKKRKSYGTSFRDTIMIDSFFYSIDNGVRVIMSYDTWIKIPTAGKEYKIRDISFEQETQPRTLGGIKDQCSNTVVGYINDVRYDGKGFGNGDNVGAATFFVTE